MASGSVPVRVDNHPFMSLVAYPSGNHIIVRSIDDQNDSFVYKGHISPTTAAKFSPDGNYIASADSAGKVRVWSWSHPEHLTKLEAKMFAGSISQLTWDVESKKILVVGDDGDKSRKFIKHLNFDTSLHSIPVPAPSPQIKSSGFLATISPRKKMFISVSNGYTTQQRQQQQQKEREQQHQHELTTNPDSSLNHHETNALHVLVGADIPSHLQAQSRPHLQCTSGRLNTGAVASKEKAVQAITHTKDGSDLEFDSSNDNGNGSDSNRDSCGDGNTDQEDDNVHSPEHKNGCDVEDEDEDEDETEMNNQGEMDPLHVHDVLVEDEEDDNEAELEPEPEPEPEIVSSVRSKSPTPPPPRSAPPSPSPPHSPLLSSPSQVQSKSKPKAKSPSKLLSDSVSLLVGEKNRNSLTPPGSDPRPNTQNHTTSSSSSVTDNHSNPRVDAETFPKYDEVSGFDVNIEVLSMLRLPQIEHAEGVNKSIFVRLDALEDIIPVQTKINAVTRGVMVDLNGEIQRVGKVFEPMYKDLSDTMSEGFQDVSKNIQTIDQHQKEENKKLWQQIIALAEENKRLHNRIDNLTDQIQELRNMILGTS